MAHLICRDMESLQLFNTPNRVLGACLEVLDWNLKMCHPKTKASHVSGKYHGQAEHTYEREVPPFYMGNKGMGQGPAQECMVK